MLVRAQNVTSGIIVSFVNDTCVKNIQIKLQFARPAMYLLNKIIKIMCRDILFYPNETFIS